MQKIVYANTLILTRQSLYNFEKPLTHKMIVYLIHLPYSVSSMEVRIGQFSHFFVVFAQRKNSDAFCSIYFHRSFDEKILNYEHEN